MATVNWSGAPLKTFGDHCVAVSWTPLTTTNLNGAPYEMPGWADRSVHVFGTFGVGATVTIQGSNETTPTNWCTLAAAGDPAEDMTFLTAGGTDLKQILEMSRWVRPLLAGGDGTSSLSIIMMIRRAGGS